jgi:hypothetical protein
VQGKMVSAVGLLSKTVASDVFLLGRAELASTQQLSITDLGDSADRIWKKIKLRAAPGFRRRSFRFGRHGAASARGLGVVSRLSVLRQLVDNETATGFQASLLAQPFFCQG